MNDKYKGSTSEWSWKRTSVSCWNEEDGKYNNPSSSIWLKGPLGMNEVMTATDGYANAITMALNDAPILAKENAKLVEQNEKMLAILKQWRYAKGFVGTLLDETKALIAEVSQ